MIKTIILNNKKIIIGGLGKLFYQEGTPISILANRAELEGMSVSWLHVADELIKHGWSNKTILNNLRDEITGCINKPDVRIIEEFINKSYEDQRDMIFNYLFQDKEQAVEFFNTLSIVC